MNHNNCPIREEQAQDPCCRTQELVASFYDPISSGDLLAHWLSLCFCFH